MIDLEFSEEQERLQSTAREFFAAECPIAKVRELEASDTGWSRDLWKRMAELDWLGLTYPEEHGGVGGSLLDLFVVYVEMGRSLAPTPHLSSALIAGETLLRAGSAEQRALLPEMARGDRLVALALTEADGAYGEHAVNLTASADGGAQRLEGTKLLVPYAHEADHLLVAARDSFGVSLFLVETAAAGVAVEKLDNIAGYPLFAVSFDAVRAAPEARVGSPGEGWSALEPSLDRASVLQCAEIAGAGEAVLEQAVAYANDRKQFGQPIGKFQAVQYLCSDIAIDLHLTSLLARQAAWRIDAGEPYRRQLAVANAQARESAQRMVRQAHEVFAGQGFMLETDIQLYSRRAKHWEFNLGDARDQYDAIAATLAG